MTKEEFVTLKPYESRMESAAKSDYARPLMRSELETLKAIYERLTEDKTIHLNCSRCILRMLKGLYPLYEAKKKELSKKSKDVEQLEPPVSDNLE